MNTATLPRLLSELTAGWWTEALAPTHPGAVCASLETLEAQWGTNSKILMRATYAPGSPTDLPEHICVKGTFGADEHALSKINAEGMEGEARFFAELAPLLEVPLPRVWHAAMGPGQGILVLDDLTRADVRFGSIREPLTPDQVASGLAALARLHGSSWRWDPARTPWLGRGFAPIRAAAQMMFTSAYWAQHFTEEFPFRPPAEIGSPERILAGFQALWRLDDAGEHCLTHGDAHVGNIYVEGDGCTVRFIDWASPNLSPWSYDVAYFVATSLSVADRRASERDLLAEYVAALRTHGGPELDSEQAWLDYRRHLLHGLVWMTIPQSMHPAENVAAISERVAASAIDHDALRLLGA